MTGAGHKAGSPRSRQAAPDGRRPPRSERAPSGLRPHPAHPVETRDGRPIRWDDWDLTKLDVASRAIAGKSWDGRYKQEHLAVGAFAMLVQELAELGCEPVVLTLLTRAASDEVRHAEICRRMAIVLLGDGQVSSRLRGVPSIPKHPGVSAETRALLHVVEMCCLSETCTGVFLTEMLTPLRGTLRSAVQSLLEDEIDHGRVGWAYLASRAREKSVGGLAEALPAMLDRTMGWVIERGEKEPEADTAPLRAAGYLGSTSAAVVYRRALRDVILPGFETCGIDTTRARAHVEARGWLKPL